MSKTFQVSGYSDDTLVLEGFLDDEIPCYKQGVVAVTTATGRVFVEVKYDNDGVWHVATVIHDDASVRVTVQPPTGEAYTDTATIEAPDDARITVTVDGKLYLDTLVRAGALDEWECAALAAGWVPPGAGAAAEEVAAEVERLRAEIERLTKERDDAILERMRVHQEAGLIEG